MRRSQEGTPEYEAFCQALHEINVYLAKKIAGDGEGATALFEAKVIGAETKEQAKTLAKSIVCSDLTKTAIAGHDANWGRIFCAMGIQGHSLIRRRLICFSRARQERFRLRKNGTAVAYSEEKATEILSQPEVTAIADIKVGNGRSICMGMRPYI